MYRAILIIAALLAGPCFALVSAAADHEWNWDLPSHIPLPRIPDDNPMSAAKVELGRHLFYDRRLSGNGTMSCSSCHLQALAFTDGRALAIGSTGEKTQRNAQGLANSAWNATFTWVNPAMLSLEQHMAIPLFSEHPVEMGMNDTNRQEILQRLREDPRYPPMFMQAFTESGGVPTTPNVIKAISAFQRSLVSVDSRFDGYVQGKEEFTPSEARGMDLFFGEKAECHHCHGSFNFNDQVVRRNSRLLEIFFHNDGLYDIGKTGAYPTTDRGLFDITGRPEDMGQFRAPSLRNVVVTAPYMHDGSVKTLEDVIDHYARGGKLTPDVANKGDGRLNPFKSSLISRIALTETDKRDLLDFLKTLTDDKFLTDPRHANPWKPIQ